MITLKMTVHIEQVEQKINIHLIQCEVKSIQRIFQELNKKKNLQ